MKTPRVCSKILLIFLLECLAVSVAFSQTPQKDNKWIRVQSDNGEFSIDVPDSYDYFFDEKGLSVSKDTSDYELKDISIFNSYRNGVLLSFDSYRSDDSKDAMKALMWGEAGTEKAEKVKIGDKVFYQMVVRNEKYYLVRQYFATKEHVYILTAASRKEGAGEIDRFLKSRTISGYLPAPASSTLTVVPISALKASPLVLDGDGAENGRLLPTKKRPAKTPQPDLPPQDDPGKFVVLTKPRPSYVTPARQANEQGDITLKMSFTTRGGVSRIEVVLTLGNGLLRQTALTALRIKYLPKEENGAPVPVIKTIVYGFAIY